MAMPRRPPAGAGSMAASDIRRAFVDTPHGQIHLRRLDGGGATPILLLHQASGSSRTMAPLMPAFAGSRPCLAPDLPGNGDSFAPADPDGADIAWYAARIDEALTAIGTGRVV